MRPDLEEYEELNDTVDAPRSRAMSWVVLTVAVGGFAALAYYAYHSGTGGGQEGDVLVVQADQTPIKETPENPEGEQFPNKDKTIYDVIAPNGDRQTEKLLPEPEHPVTAKDVEDEDSDGMAPPSATANAPVTVPAQSAAVPPIAGVPPTAATPAPATTTFVNKGMEGTKPPADPVDVQAMKQPAPATAPEVKEVPVATVAKPVKPGTGEPKFVNEKPKKEEPKKTAAKSTGTYQVQLGAFGSEEEAQNAWKKISGKFSDVLTGSHTVVQAEVNGKTYYRLRASGFASSDAAKAACAKLSGKGQACMLAGK